MVTDGEVIADRDVIVPQVLMEHVVHIGETAAHWQEVKPWTSATAVCDAGETQTPSFCFAVLFLL